MLPGRLCIGILEEDNPLKSYFRLKPLLVECEGKYEVFDGEAVYPEDGCIRIVPDKNESSHFKGRMRRMGRYCVLDLREHTGENDKIRPNKNYRGDESERNAHIVYSDVVREPAADMIFEIAAFDHESGIWEGEAPGTPRILSPESLDTWRFMPAEEGELAHVERDGQALREDEIQRFDIPGFPGQTLQLAIRLPAALPSVLGVPAPKAEPAPEQPKPAPRPAAEEKPWISHDHMPPPPPQPSGVHLSPMQQTLLAQSGLNPRRNRSLQEIIEEKWRHSRVDQLGHPIPAQAMGQPVESPVDRAINALRDAWNIPEIRGQLVEALGGMHELSYRVEHHKLNTAEAERRRELEDMEAERLRALADLDKLRRDKKALRDSFKQEIRQEEADAFKDAVERTKAAQAECTKYEAAAEEARKGAELAQDAFRSLKDGRFEEKLRDFALTSRAAELLGKAGDEQPAAPAVSEEAPSREEWLQRMKEAFASEGLHISPIQAANLLVCAALGESMIISGPAACDKLAAARALGKAMGSYREISGRDANAGDAIVALVPNANHKPGADVCRGLGRADRRVVSVVADSGFPISPESLERSFLIRMEAPAADSPWRPLPKGECALAPVSVAALRSAVLVEDGELPAALERRLQKVRTALAQHKVRLSRGSLDAMWHFCTAMLATGKVSPGEALDMAFAQKALPGVLAEAPVECLVELKTILADMPRCIAMLDEPLPILV
ncbi:MAG: hypothetical protein IJ466_02505 [Clostridia bacterium]|nr:hypothetical protein [Clostridia bacterium]